MLDASLLSAPVLGAPSGMTWLWRGGSRVASALGGRALTKSGAVRELGSKFGASSAVTFDTTTNLVPNPSFEVNTAGWIPFGGGASIARVAGGIAAGAWSCEVTASAATEGVQSSSPITGIVGATAYTMSVHLVVPVGKSVQVQWNEYDSGGGYLGVSHSSVVGGAVGMQRVAITATTNASCAMIALFAYTVGAGAVFSVDGWQLEAASAATAYCDGALGSGQAWTGTAHQSPSTRTAGRVQARSAGCDSMRGSVAMWWRPAWGTSIAGDRPLLRWGDGDAYLDVRYADAGNCFRVGSKVAGASADVVESGAQSFVAEQDVLVIAMWDEGRVTVSVDGGAAVSAARSGGVPSIAAALLDLGSDGAGIYGQGAIGPVVWFERVLDPHEVAVLARLERVPRWQEVA